MPNTTSAKKRLRQSVDRRARNRVVKSNVRKQLRRVREAVQSGDVAQAEQEFRLACKKLDKAGAKGVMHPKTTSRYKSRLSARIKAAKQSA